MGGPCATRYLGLLKKTLTGTLYDEGRWTVRGTGRNLIHRMVIAALRKRSISLISSREFDPLRREREDWPVIGFTMVGVKRLDNIHDRIARVIADKVAGDFVECGVWRGGASIFARAAFDVYGATDRTVWLAASFEGMPKLTSAADKIDQDFSDHDYLAVPLDQVKDNFRNLIYSATTSNSSRDGSQTVAPRRRSSRSLFFALMVITTVQLWMRRTAFMAR
jgi:hypothetical protein